MNPIDGLVATQLDGMVGEYVGRVNVLFDKVPETARVFLLIPLLNWIA